MDDPHPGDMTLDGNVDYDDLLVLSQNFNAAGSLQRITGDLNGDDAVNFDDHLEMAQNFNYTGGPAAPAHTRTVNAANEITDISQTGWVTPAYDDAGNMISGPKAGADGTRLHFTYDAWNHLVFVYSDNAGTPDELIASYEYDGASRRVQKTLGEGESAVVQDVYFNSGWQVLEVRQDGDLDPLDQYLWDLSYIDTPVLRFHDGNADGDVADVTGEDPPDNTLYYMTDVNHNVTGLYDGDLGIVVERYFTDPYGGGVTVYDRVWQTLSSSAYANPVQFGGYWFDQETGNDYARNRYYNARIGTWSSRDPAGYVDGASLVQYLRSQPLNGSDPLGLQSPPPATQPRPVFWIRAGQEDPVDLVVVAYEREDRFDPNGITVKGLEAAAKAMKAGFLAHPKSAKEISEKIIATAEAKRKLKGIPEGQKFPISVIIIGHGNEKDGPAVGSPYLAGDKDGQYFAPLFPTWALLSQDDQLKKRSVQEAVKESPLYQVKGYVREMTFCACDVAKSESGRMLHDVLAEDFHALLRGFKWLTNPGGDKRGIQVVPTMYKKGAINTYGDFVYERDGRHAQSQK